MSWGIGVVWQDETCLFKLLAFSVEDIEDISLVNGLLFCGSHGMDQVKVLTVLMVGLGIVFEEESLVK